MLTLTLEGFQLTARTRRPLWSRGNPGPRLGSPHLSSSPPTKPSMQALSVQLRVRGCSQHDSVTRAGKRPRHSEGAHGCVQVKGSLLRSPSAEGCWGASFMTFQPGEPACWPAVRCAPRLGVGGAAEGGRLTALRGEAAARPKPQRPQAWSRTCASFGAASCSSASSWPGSILRYRFSNISTSVRSRALA